MLVSQNLEHHNCKTKIFFYIAVKIKIDSFYGRNDRVSKILKEDHKLNQSHNQSFTPVHCSVFKTAPTTLSMLNTLFFAKN